MPPGAEQYPSVSPFPLGLVLLVWPPRRLRWMRRAVVVASFRDAPAGRDLLRLRALATGCCASWPGSVPRRSPIRSGAVATPRWTP